MSEHGRRTRIAYLLEEVPHLDLHLLNHLPRVRNVRCLVLQGKILLRLTRHASAQRDLPFALRVVLFWGGAQSLALHDILFVASGRGRPVDHLQHDRRSELVVGLSAALSGLEDVDGVPGARRLAR